MAIITTIDFDQLLDYRFDAECYRPDLQAVERRIAAKACGSLQGVAHVSDGNHISIASDFADSGVRYLKGAELSDVFIDDSDPTYIPARVYGQIARAHVLRGDVLLSVIGSVGPVAFVNDKYERLSCSCKLAILRPHGISGALLAAYLLSPTGQSLLLRRNRGSVQQGVVLPDIRTFPVPRFGAAISSKVERLMAAAAAEKARADALYPEAESELLERAGWERLCKERVETHYSVNFDQIGSMHRSDAEFFHPMYGRLRTELSKQGTEFSKLVTSLDKGTQPSIYDRSGEIAVVKSKQVTGRELLIQNCERTDGIAWEDVPARLCPGDVVINSTGRGTIGRAAVVPQMEGKAVAAVDLVIARLRRELVDPTYLALFLNSPIGLAQTDQFQTGSSGQLHLYPQHFSKFMIFLPRQKKGGGVDSLWQRRLAEMINAATQAKAAARSKVEQAIRIVEDSLNSMALT